MENKVLVVYYNTWIYAQTLFVCDQEGITDFDVAISDGYSKNKSFVSTTREWLEKHIDKKIVDINKLTEDYDIIIRPTPYREDG